jgi:hypothetical protein
MMRTFELSTRITGISRGDGRSATAAAAYRACCAIRCERENRLHDYRRKRGLEISRIIAPQSAPAWSMDRASLWNAAELRERNGTRGRNAGTFKANAKIAREFMFGFPAELSAAGRLAVAEAIARHLVDTHGVVADFSIHQPGKEGDERNFHCHMLTTTRRMTEAGLGEKAREWDALGSGAKLSKQFRAFVAKTMNEALAAEGQAGAVHVEHRSFKERGGTQRPQKHLGPTRTNVLRRNLRQARQAWQAAHAHDQQERQRRERAALVARQARALDQKLRDIAEREQRAIAAIRDAHRPEPAPEQRSGLNRLTQIFGRASAPPIETPERALQRERQIASETAAVCRTFQAERDAYSAAQAKERQALDDRHAADNRQLDTATGHRVTHDRLIERQERQGPTQDREDHQQTIERDSGRSPPR